MVFSAICQTGKNRFLVQTNKSEGKGHFSISIIYFTSSLFSLNRWFAFPLSESLSTDQHIPYLITSIDWRLKLMSLIRLTTTTMAFHNRDNKETK